MLATLARASNSAARLESNTLLSATKQAKGLNQMRMHKMFVTATMAAIMSISAIAGASAQQAPKLSIPVPASAAQKPLIGRANTVSDPNQAIAIAKASEQALAQKCAAKGPLYRFKPAQVAGQASPNGGVYVSTSGAKCSKLTLTEAINAGLVQVRQ